MKIFVITFANSIFASFTPNYIELAKKNTHEVTCKETTVYSRVTDNYGVQQDTPIANFTIPAALFFETSLENTDFAKVKVQEMYMDVKTYNDLSDKQKAQLGSGQFDSDKLITPTQEKGEMTERYPTIKEISWESTKNNLDRLFEKYQEIE